MIGAEPLTVLEPSEYRRERTTDPEIESRAKKSAGITAVPSITVYSTEPITADVDFRKWSVNSQGRMVLIKAGLGEIVRWKSADTYRCSTVPEAVAVTLAWNS